MSLDPLQWTDQASTAHQLRPASDLSATERGQLNLLRQQVGYVAFLLDASFTAPAIGQARPNMMRVMLRLLLPNVAEKEIATFDTATGTDLLTHRTANAHS